MTMKANMIRVDISDEGVKPMVADLLNAVTGADEKGCARDLECICIDSNSALLIAGTLYALRMALDAAQDEIAAFAYAGQTVQ